MADGASRTRDLSKGSLVGHYRALAIPAAIGFVFTTLYNVVDTWFAGLLSTDAQAGLSISFLAYFMLIGLGIGLGTAMGALVGNAMGAGRAEDAGRIAAEGIGFAALTSLVIGVASIWIGPLILNVISEPGGYRDAANSYFLWLLLAVPGFVMGFAINGILQALGDAVSNQRALIAAFFANLALNPVLIFGIPGYWDGIGFNGLAVSTIISQTGVMLYLVRQVLKTDLGPSVSWSALLPRPASAGQIVLQAAPVSFAMLVMIMAGFVAQNFLKEFGAAAVAAYGVALRVEQLFLLPVFGLTGALLPIAAQNYGAGEIDRVRAALYACWKYGFLFMAIACPTLWLAAPFLMSVFSPDPEVIAIGASYLRVDGVILPAYMMLFAINSFLQALKRPIWTLWIGLYRQGFAVVLFVWLFVKVWEFDHTGVWYGVATAVTTGLVLSLLVAEHVARPLIGSIWPGRRRQAA